jgi:hypothetical protein
MQCAISSSSLCRCLEVTFFPLTGEKIFPEYIESPALFYLMVTHPGTKNLLKRLSYVGCSKFYKCLNQVSEQVFLTYGITLGIPKSSYVVFLTGPTFGTELYVAAIVTK